MLGRRRQGRHLVRAKGSALGSCRAQADHRRSWRSVLSTRWLAENRQGVGVRMRTGTGWRCPAGVRNQKLKFGWLPALRRYRELSGANLGHRIQKIESDVHLSEGQKCLAAAPWAFGHPSIFVSRSRIASASAAPRSIFQSPLPITHADHPVHRQNLIRQHINGLGLLTQYR